MVLLMLVTVPPSTMTPPPLPARVAADRGVDERQTRRGCSGADRAAVDCRRFAGQRRIDDGQRAVVHDRAAVAGCVAAADRQTNDAHRLAGVDIEHSAGVVAADRDADSNRCC